MCTSITFQSRKMENFLGRTMDFSYDIDSGIYVIPKNYQWYNNAIIGSHTHRYKFICMAQEDEDVLGIFDGVNERGLAAAALYFEGYVYYDLPIRNKEVIS